MQLYLKALFKPTDKRTAADSDIILLFLKQSRQIRQLLKYGDNMAAVLRKYLCSSLVLKKVPMGQLVVEDQKKDNEFYAILEGDALLLDQKSKETIQEEIDVLDQMVSK